MPEPLPLEQPRRTKIVATIGPATWDEPVLTQLLEAGVDVARINASHADHEGIRRQVSRVRRASAKLGKPVAILLDLQGPKIRVGDLDAPLALAEGDVLVVVMDEDYVANGLRVGTTYPEMAKDVNPGDAVLFDDGALAGEVVKVDIEAVPAEVHVKMTVAGDLGSHKGMNLPGVEMSVPSLTDKDRSDVLVGLEVGVDYVALSFVRRAADVLALRTIIDQYGPRVPIIAKIEKPQAVEHLGEILDVADGVMVARGDLGVEVPLEKVPVLQKEIIQQAFRKGALVITATQMLDSMIRNPRPTRAETTDVANAILDGTDAIMLSGETATGKFPVRAVRTMDRIARSVEQSRFFNPVDPRLLKVPPGAAGVLMRSALYCADEKNRPLVVFTWSGSSAILISKGRPPAPVYAFTPDRRVCDRLALAWGITPLPMAAVMSVDDMIAAGEQVLLDRKLVKTGEELVIVAGKAPTKRAAYLLKIIEAGRD